EKQDCIKCELHGEKPTRTQISLIKKTEYSEGISIAPLYDGGNSDINVIWLNTIISYLTTSTTVAFCVEF
ncbi:hypothetical protein, partial [Acetobacter pasteurianus]|uniref:hypothetical protein n=1 Tax=Acetobacter pasteurianus TaxID=438 RepID=UPI001BE045DF